MGNAAKSSKESISSVGIVAGDPTPCISANDCKSFGPAAIKDAVDEFMKGRWFSRATKFVLCISEGEVPTKHADTIEEQARRLAERKIAFEVWGRERISELLKAHPELVGDFFGREWVKAFCGVEVAESLGIRLDALSAEKFRRELGEFYRYLFDSQDPGIPRPRREGARPFPLDFSSLSEFHSGRTAEMVLRRLRRWVYSRNGWQAGWLFHVGMVAEVQLCGVLERFLLGSEMIAVPLLESSISTAVGITCVMPAFRKSIVWQSSLTVN
jgi:hypothetical protein